MRRLIAAALVGGALGGLVVHLLGGRRDSPAPPRPGAPACAQVLACVNAAQAIRAASASGSGRVTAPDLPPAPAPLAAAPAPEFAGVPPDVEDLLRRGKLDEATGALRARAELSSSTRDRDLLLIEEARVWLGHGRSDRAQAALDLVRGGDPRVDELVRAVRTWIARARAVTP